MRAGRVEEAAAVAKRIAIDITKCNKTRLNHVNLKKAVGTFGPQYESSQADPLNYFSELRVSLLNTLAAKELNR